jgi:hypothetical protein
MIEVMKVQIWFKSLWVVVTIFSAVSLVWFLLGSTSNFHRALDIVGTYLLIQAWIPALAIMILSIVLLIKGWTPSSRVTYIGFFSGLILLLFLSVSLIQNVSAQGWLNEKNTSDSLKITSDGKYEYRINLINLFQKNSHARLYLKVVSTGEELRIPIDIQTDKIVGLGVKKVNNWVMLEPLDVSSSRYILYTTKELGITEERFEIDIIEGTSKKLE